MIGEIAVIPQTEGPAREIVAAAVAEIASAGLRYEVDPPAPALRATSQRSSKRCARSKAACARRVCVAL